MPGVVTESDTVFDMPRPFLRLLLGRLSARVPSMPSVRAARTYPAGATMDRRPGTRRRMGSRGEDRVVRLRCCTSTECGSSRLRRSESLHATWTEHDSLDTISGPTGPQIGRGYMRREGTVTYGTLGTTYGVIYVQIGH